ncbi:MAG: DNA double-strand break repair protein Mre11 [Halanaeroarchaeum sp.]
MSRVIHTGDTHVGYRQYHSPVRRQDFLSAFRQVVEDAVEEDVDAVVHAGDLFDDRRPDLPDILETISILRDLDRADVPFLAVVGNHEDARRGQWLDLFETLDLAVHLGREGTVVEDTTFYGLDYVPESRREDLAYDFAPTDTDHDALVGHGLFSPFPHGDWDLEAILSASPVDFDAVLLGDDHVHRTREIGDTWATYCGSTERTSASEREARGYNLVEFDEGVRISRRGLDTRDFVFVDVELAASEGEPLVRERIREADVEDAVVIVTVEGDGGDVTPAEVEAFGEERGALVTRVNDRREFDEDAEVDVSFADPDEAVRNRVREMGLSDAARSIDRTIRDDDVADANVRSRVRETVESLLDDPDAFEGVEAPDRRDEDASDAADDEGPTEATESDETDDTNEADESGEPEETGEPDKVGEHEGVEREGAGGEDEQTAVSREAESPDDAGENEPSDSQATTMEDFL